MTRKFERSDAADATNATRTHRARRTVSSPTVRAIMVLSHYKFKVLLKYKMERAGGRLIECGEEFTSKTCSRCGCVKGDLGRCETFKCRSCSFTHDRDVNAAKNIFITNIAQLWR